MVFGFLKRLYSPEGGYDAINASYQKHFRLAESQRIEPVSMGLFGALGSRYKLRGKFVSDMVHMVEVAPFMLIDERTRVRALANYLMADEIPDQIDQHAVREIINDAILSGKTGDDAYDLIVSSMPHLPNLPIRWVDWLNDKNKERLSQTFLSDSNEEQS